MSIIGVRVVKVSHANEILQLVDPAYAAAQKHAKTRIWNCHFWSVFLPSCCEGACRYRHG